MSVSISGEGSVTGIDQGLNVVGVVTATQVKVGSAVTIHSGGYQVGSSDIHSSGIRVNAINSSGISTFSGGLLVGTGASISSPATNVLTLGTNSVERVRVSAAGSFGIGTDSPSQRLHVFSASNGGQFGVDNSGQQYTSINFFNTGVRKSVVEWNNTDNILAVAVDNVGSPSGGLALSTGNSQRLIIDSSGRVRMPAQVGFFANSDTTYSSITPGSNSDLKISMGSTLWNTGNCWDTTNDRFAAPVAGKYYFTINLYIGVEGTGVRVLHCEWRRNNTQVTTVNLCGGITNGGGTQYHPTFAHSIILDLAANDTVDFRINSFAGNFSGLFIYSGVQSHITGHLLG